MKPLRLDHLKEAFPPLPEETIWDWLKRAKDSHAISVTSFYETVHFIGIPLTMDAPAINGRNLPTSHNK